jgi:hypothetical protein
MKNLLLIAVAALLLGATTGCSDYLDKMPDDQLTMEMIFSDKIRTEDWLASVYSSVPSPMWGYFKNQGWAVMGDDLTFPAEWTPYGWENVYNYMEGNWSPISAWDPYYWVELPKRIRTGLIFLENVYADEKRDIDEAYANQMKNEVRFLIAYYYSLMIEIYGPIPFKPGVIEAVDAPTSELMTTQTPYDEIVDWIDRELKDVSNNLPAVYENASSWGRATKIMCLAIRARTLLFAASPLFNGNEDLMNWKNKDGENLFRPADPTKWARAAQAHKELIDSAEANGYALYYEYNDDNSIDPFMSYYNMSLKTFSNGNKEIIFGRPNGNGDVNWWRGHHLPKGIGGNAALEVTQELVDAFYTKNGLPINEDPDYTESGFSTAAEVRKTKWPGGGQNKPGQVTAQGIYNMYCNREPRFYVSVIYNGAWLNVANRAVNFLSGGIDTQPTFDSPHVGYNVRKRISLDVSPAQGKWGEYQPAILYRLAEAYLSYAEALNESQPGHPDILKYLNLVRERAGIPNVAAGKSQDEMRKIIRHERRVEFNCEGIRFHDIRRWKIGEETLNAELWGMNVKGNQKSDDPTNDRAYYKRVFYKTRKFTKKMYLWPVPQAQMDINPNLTPTPGY